MAGKVDAVYFFLVAVSLFFFFLICSLITFFAIRYRKRSDEDRPVAVHGSLSLELLWTIVPFCLSMVMFGWGAVLYFDLYSPPADSMNIYVVGKQWMWKLQHPEGNREINELHVPVDTNVRLIMTSEDVIHSFYIPAFRIKMDVLPGRYTSAWFRATKVGTYHLFCAEYCGTKHSEMVGSVHVMDPVDYEEWLNRASGSVLSMVETGEQLYTQLGCGTCHEQVDGARGPSLAGLFGQEVELFTGETVIADDAYLRRSILEPASEIVAGYGPLMPTYKGQVNEEDLLRLIAYIKSLSAHSNEPEPAPSN